MNDCEYDCCAARYTQYWSRSALDNGGYAQFKKSVAQLERTFISDAVENMRNRLSTKRVTRILDVGCGTGERTLWLLDSLLPSKYEYIGIDCNSNMLNQHVLARNSRSAIRHHLLEVDINLYGPPEGHFDLIVALHSLYGISARILRDIVNSLEPDGVMTAFMCSRYGLFSKLNRQGQFAMLTAEDTEARLKTHGNKFESFTLSYSFPDEMICDLSWLRYLVQDPSIRIKDYVPEPYPAKEIEKLLLVYGK